MLIPGPPNISIGTETPPSGTLGTRNSRAEQAREHDAINNDKLHDLEVGLRATLL